MPALSAIPAVERGAGSISTTQTSVLQGVTLNHVRKIVNPGRHTVAKSRGCVARAARQLMPCEQVLLLLDYLRRDTEIGVAHAATPGEADA